MSFRPLPANIKFVKGGGGAHEGFSAIVEAD